VPLPVTLFCVKEQVRPVEGEELTDRFTTPEKPELAAIVIVEKLLYPAFSVIEVNCEEIVKSKKVTVVCPLA